MLKCPNLYAAYVNQNDIKSIAQFQYRCLPFSLPHGITGQG